jgi:hypothetical protein
VPQAGEWALIELECRDAIDLRNDYDATLDYVKPKREPVQRATPTRPGTVALSGGDDPLKRISAHVYFEMVAGIPVPSSGWVSCPTPQHEDRHPSCTVAETHWRCWSCGAGGTMIDLGAAIYGLEPTGSGYLEIRRRLLADLGFARSER